MTIIEIIVSTVVLPLNVTRLLPWVLVWLRGRAKRSALNASKALNETEQLVTKDFLKSELQELKAELRLGMQQIRTEMQQLRTEMQQLRGDVFQQLRADQRWTVGLIIGVYATNIATLLVILFKSH